MPEVGHRLGDIFVAAVSTIGVSSQGGVGWGVGGGGATGCA